MVRLHVAVFPQSSVASQVRVTLYVLPQAAEVTSEKVMSTLASHTSVALADPKTGEAGQLIGEDTAGQVMAGGVLSMRVLYVAFAEFACASVAVTVTTALHVPAVDAPYVMVPGQLSVAEVAASAAACASATEA